MSNPLSPGRFRPVGFPVTARRVVRGGSWNNNSGDARASYRNHNLPGDRANEIGVRLVCASHILDILQRRGPVGVLPPDRCELIASNNAIGLPEPVADYGLQPEAKD